MNDILAGGFMDDSEGEDEDGEEVTVLHMFVSSLAI